MGVDETSEGFRRKGRGKVEVVVSVPIPSPEDRGDVNLSRPNKFRVPPSV